ncbi:MAG: flagellar motor switch protein FliN [Treponema sp.]|nr:flagellar motor switch protein FliN [Treponema sp.]
MSDGALSQDEIDALLSGVDSSSLAGLGGGHGAPAATMTAPAHVNFDSNALQTFFASTTNALSANLSALTGATVALTGPQVSAFNRDTFISQLPDMVTSIAANYTSGFPGEHLFILPETSSRAIASLMTKEDNIALDDMAMSVIGEVVSQMVGTQITAMTDKTGNKSIAAASPMAANVPKATAALPAGDFAVMVYNLNLGDGQSHKMWEILGSTPATDISHGLAGGGHPAKNANPGMQQQMQGMGMGMGMPMQQGMGMGMQGMPMQGMGMQGMGMGMGMPMQGMGMQGMGLGAANVQQVQFPNLMQPRLGAHEAGNIGLIMDVSMEMTVELGRTRKLIKEILGMGEGTIIELDKLAGEPVDILVNHKLIAKGEVVVIDENFGVRVTEIVSPMERINDMGYN